MREYKSAVKIEPDFRLIIRNLRLVETSGSTCQI